MSGRASSLEKGGGGRLCGGLDVIRRSDPETLGVESWFCGELVIHVSGAVLLDRKDRSENVVLGNRL